MSQKAVCWSRRVSPHHVAFAFGSHTVWLWAEVCVCVSYRYSWVLWMVWQVPWQLYSVLPRITAPINENKCATFSFSSRWASVCPSAHTKFVSVYDCVWKDTDVWAEERERRDQCEVWSALTKAYFGGYFYNWNREASIKKVKYILKPVRKKREDIFPQGLFFYSLWGHIF